MWTELCRIRTPRRQLFELSLRIIDAAGLSGESVRYYASLVDYYTAYKLKQMDRETVHLYLLCFIHNRYQRLNDNLLTAFCSLVRRYILEAGGTIVRDRYEFLLYRLLRERLEAGDLYCKDSARFRCFDDDLLDYIDSPALRHNVQRALNRGEAYHQLRRAIAYAHGGRYRVHSQHEQEIWNECSRLVGNAVVYYNALILSEALAELESRGELASAEVLKRVSPVAWQHINFYGRYQFDTDFTPINLAQLRQQLLSEEVSRLYASTDR